MATDGETGFEMRAHEGTYAGFLALFKWGALGCAIIVAIVVVLIAS